MQLIIYVKTFQTKPSKFFEIIWKIFVCVSNFRINQFYLLQINIFQMIFCIIQMWLEKRCLKASTGPSIHTFWDEFLIPFICHGTQFFSYGIRETIS